MTLEIQTDLQAQQRQRERHSLRIGLKQLRENTNLGSFQQRLFKDFLPSLTEAIDQRKTAMQGTKAKLPDFVLAAIGSEELALITIVSVMYCIADSQQDLTKSGRQYAATLRRTALRIGQHCRDRFLGDVSADTGDGTSDLQIESRLMTILADRQKNRWNAAKRAEQTIEAMKTEDWWSLSRMIAVGGELIHIAMKSTGLFEKTYKSLGKDDNKRTAILRLTDVGAKWLDARRNDRKRGAEKQGILSIPFNVPMLVEPKPWIDLKGGGYLTLTSVLIKPNDKNCVPDDFYDITTMPAVTTAVDLLQRTAWEINPRVFQSYKKCWDNASYREKFFNPEHATFSKNELMASIEMKISTCEDLLGKTFFFPYQLDFRGRVYAVPHILNTQSDDPTRSLLQFATAAPVSDRSQFWTAIHAANGFGLNKLTLDGRHSWCQEHLSQIEALVADPFKHVDFWSQAKEPWAFLAACYELIDIRRGASTTRLPIYVDGKCNGLQHLSAMSRDEHAGQRVNLLPGEQPQDIYDHVAKQVEALVAADKSASAKYWHGKINRDLVKRPVMTTPYGVTPSGIKDQLKDAAKSLRPSKDALAYISKKVVRAIEDVMHGPAEVQNWLQSIAKDMATAHSSLIWTVPSGFRVCQDYRKPKFKRLSAGKFSVRFYLPVDGERPIDKRKQATGIIANFVHSMDGAHLVQVVNRLNGAGISNVGVVHDSFGVHACHVDIMNQVIREEFVRIYSEPVLQKFLQEQVERTGLNLPTFDAYGNLAIESVLKSPYFFS